jgi:hypothetical protein
MNSKPLTRTSLLCFRTSIPLLSQMQLSTSLMGRSTTSPPSSPISITDLHRDTVASGPYSKGKNPWGEFVFVVRDRFSFVRSTPGNWLTVLLRCRAMDGWSLRVGHSWYRGPAKRSSPAPAQNIAQRDYTRRFALPQVAVHWHQHPHFYQYVQGHRPLHGVVLSFRWFHTSVSPNFTLRMQKLCCSITCYRQ